MEQLLNPAVMAMLIPIVAIVGGFVYKLRKMEIERNGGMNYEEVQAMHDEILSLRRRMENVEAIIASDSDNPKIDLDATSKDAEKSRDTSNDRGLKNMLR
jgi:hypothetical protein